MAQLTPDIAAICRLRPRPEEGEIRLLEMLDRSLDESYEVFFQPLLHVDKPDVVVLRRGCGVLLIEVKDWNLGCYGIDQDGQMFVRQNGAPIASPLEQVQHYKERLINLYIPELCSQVLKRKELWALVSTAVYCDCAETAFAQRFFAPIRTAKPQTTRCHVFGRDSLSKDGLLGLMDRSHLATRSLLLSDGVYKELCRLLRPPAHRAEDGKPLQYSREQSPHVISRPGDRKIFGAVGSGKTTVLAQRAVNAHTRTGRPILFLTFNITLRNYVHDRISRVRQDFAWTNFVISHYHLFFVSMAQRHNLPIDREPPDDEAAYCDNEFFFEPVKQFTERFCGVFIDEVQDYKIEWLRLIRRYFCTEDCEFVLAGDEKQRVYERELDGKKILTNVLGRPAHLKTSHRLRDWLCALSSDFQTEYLSIKYEAELVGTNRSLEFSPSQKRYSFTEKAVQPAHLSRLIEERIREWNVEHNNVTVLCPDIDTIRKIERELRSYYGCTFVSETCEEWDLIQQRYQDSNQQEREAQKIRRSRRYNFWRDSGLLKLSTVHSYKGWESEMVVCIITEKMKEEIADELVYTGFTRTLDHLWIINYGNKRYHEFFRNRIVNFDELSKLDL